MHKHDSQQEDPLAKLGYEAGYEMRDINITGLRNTAFFFFGFSILCFAVVGVWFYIAKPAMGSELAPNKPMPPILLQSDATVRADIATFRQNETQRLSTSGPNPDGTYHIPVDQALEVIAQRGLPHTQTATPAASPGNTITQNAVGPGSSVPMSIPATPSSAPPANANPGASVPARPVTGGPVGTP